MRTLLGAVIVGISATAMFLGCTGLGQSNPVSAMGTVRVSDDASRVPRSPDIEIGSLPGTSSAIRTSAAHAIDVAKQHFWVQDAEIDQSVGVVSVMAGIRGDARHRSAPSWIVTVDRTYRLPSPIGVPSPGDTHRLCVVIDAATGEYEYAYLVA